MEQVSAFERRRGRGKPRPYADMVHFVFLPVVEEELARLEELDVPAGDEDLVDFILFTERAAVDKVAIMPRVASIKAA